MPLAPGIEEQKIDEVLRLVVQKRLLIDGLFASCASFVVGVFAPAAKVVAVFGEAEVEVEVDGGSVGGSSSAAGGGGGGSDGGSL